MSGPEYPDAPPPEVPEEFAAAYREAYLRALQAGEGADPGTEVDTDSLGLPPQQVARVGTHRPEQEGQGDPGASLSASPWFRPAVLAVLALLLIGSAYGVGTALSRDNGPDTATTRNATTISTPTAPPARSEPSTSPGGWDGPVTEVPVAAISADCTAPPSSDAAGRRVSYVPQNAIDGKPETAWRCPGTAVGQKLTLRLSADTKVAEVGLVPGYAKIDPASGVDRYAENNRITRVRWTLGDGVSFEQILDPSLRARSMQRLRVPVTATGTVVLQVLAVKQGPRDTTAISAIEIAAAQDG